MNDEQIEALRTKYGFDRIGIIEGEFYLPMKDVFRVLEQKWIPCSEKMPSDCGKDWVLVQIRADDFLLIPRIAECRQGKWWLLDSEYPLEEELSSWEVIAWMPLPSVYSDIRVKMKPQGISLTHECRVANCPNCKKFIREINSSNKCEHCNILLDWGKMPLPEPYAEK